MKRTCCIIILFFLVKGTLAQTLGGNAAFHFLVQSNNAQLSALGGVNVSNINNDVGMCFQNPALLRDEMHQQLSASFNSFVGGIKNYSLTSAFHLEKQHTNLSFGVNYFNYGTVTQTDASGNVLGDFRPADYVVQASASRSYQQHWWYGMTVKFASSNYGQYRSSGFAADVGVAYFDSSRHLQVSMVVKNIGTQLKSYDGSSSKEELPFDLEAGITKKLARAPIQFSLTAHHLQAFNIHYNDTLFRASEGDDVYGGNNTLLKIASHLVISAQIFLNNKLELTTGYNFLRRNDLNAYNQANGLNGFTLGLGVLLKKLHIRYATGFYQQTMFHQFSLNLNWKGTEL